MQQTRAVEIGTGLFVFLGFAALLFLSTQTTNLEAYIGANSYTVTAHFNNVGGLKPRSPVSMAGVTIGRVEKIGFDPEQLNAVVTLNISGKYDRIPEDSDASILTAGLLGGQYVGLQPGGSDRYLEDGDEIMFTQSAVVLENLISKYLFSAGSRPSEDKDEDGDEAPDAPEPEEAPQEARQETRLETGGDEMPVADPPAPDELDDLDELDGTNTPGGPRETADEADPALPDEEQGTEENQ